jgi:hypothetical protein
MTLSVSKSYSVNDRKINAYGAVGGRRIAGETRVLRKNLPQCQFVHYNSHII